MNKITQTYHIQNEHIYSSINNSQNKANIIHINNRYAAVKPYKNNNKLLKSFTHTELKKYILNKITLAQLRLIPLTSSHCLHLLHLQPTKRSSF